MQIGGERAFKAEGSAKYYGPEAGVCGVFQRRAREKSECLEESRWVKWK